MAATCSQTPTHLAKGKIRNGSILYGSTRVISGAPTQIQSLVYRWMHGSRIWSRLSKPPKARLDTACSLIRLKRRDFITLLGGVAARGACAAGRAHAPRRFKEVVSE